MTLPYYVYTSGEVARDMLNATATFFQTSTMGSLIEIALMFSVVATLLTFFLTRNPAALWKWAAVYFFIPLFLIDMKTDMQVIDLTEPSAGMNVGNVPYLIAIPTYLSSTMMYGFTQTVESIYVTAGDESYGQTGMLFGSKLYRLSNLSSIKDITLKTNWINFFKNCIVGDITINKKYSWDDLYESTDIIGFLDTQTMSPLRGLYYGDKYLSCSEAYPVIKAKIDADVDNNLNLMGSYLYGEDADTKASTLNTSLANSYATYAGISANASTIVRQNMAMNAIRNGTLDMDDTASALNYAYTQNKMQTTSMWAGIAMQAKEYMPMMHTILFVLYGMLGVFVAAAALIPSLTMMVLSNYFKTFIVLATWPALFSVLNFMMTSSLSYTTLGITDGINGVTMSNENALDEVHTRFGLLAGYLMMSVPLIAGAILKGGSAVMSSLNYQMAGMINSTNSRTSAAAASGDVNLGNMQVDTRSWANDSANKHDTNLLDRTSGLQSEQKADGSMHTKLGNGNMAYSNQESVSNLHWNVGSNNDVLSTLNQGFQASQANVETYTDQLNQNLANGNSLTANWTETQSKQESYGEGYSHNESTQVTNGTNKINSATDNLSEEMGWSKEKSEAFLRTLSASAYVREEIEAGGDFGVIAGKVAGGLEGSYRLTSEDRDNFSNMNSERLSNIVSNVDQYSEGANEIIGASKTITDNEANTNLKQYADSFASNWNETQNISQNLSRSQTETESLSLALSNVDQNGISLKENLMPSFQKFIEEREDDNAASIMTDTSAEGAATRNELWDKYRSTDGFKNDVYQAAGIPAIQADSSPLAFTPSQNQQFEQNSENTFSNFTQDKNRLEKMNNVDALYDQEDADYNKSKAKGTMFVQSVDADGTINQLEKNRTDFVSQENEKPPSKEEVLQRIEDFDPNQATLLGGNNKNEK